MTTTDDKKVSEAAKYRRFLKFPKQGLISEVFHHEDAIRAAIQEARMDKPAPKVTIKGHAFISNPTENKAIRNLTPLRQIECRDGFWLNNPERWLDVIEHTYKFCPDASSKKAFRMWADGYNVTQISMRVGMSQTAFYDMRMRLQDYATALAAQYGLIKIVD